jgi:ERCC4-related helicase
MLSIEQCFSKTLSLLKTEDENKKQEIIYEDRSYQRAIIQTCIEKNSIVYLPTGAGKTFIAIQVLKILSSQIEK